MIRKILIDAGMNRGKPCSGRQNEPADVPATRIGAALSGRLESMGYEVLYSENVPELAEYEENGAGRPSACASVARRWGADCVLRLCIRAADLPGRGSADGLIYRSCSSAWSIANAVLQSVGAQTELRCNAPRQTQGMLLLRRTHCPGMVLVLRLPFRQKEDLNADETAGYAMAIADGIHQWAHPRERS